MLQSLHNIFPSTTFVLQSQGLHNTIYFRAIPSSPASPASPWQSNFDGSLQSLACKSGTASTKAGLQSQAWKQPFPCKLQAWTAKHNGTAHRIISLTSKINGCGTRPTSAHIPSVTWRKFGDVGHLNFALISYNLYHWYLYQPPLEFRYVFFRLNIS